MLTMSLTAKEDQPCNPKRTLSKGESAYRLLFIHIPIIAIVNFFISSSSLLLFFVILKARANARNNTKHCWGQQCCPLLRDVSRCVQTLATSHNMLSL